MQNINISYSSLLRILVVIAAVALVYVLRDIILILFLSIILSSALEPLVSWFERRSLPRGFGVLTVYVFMFAIVSLIVILLVPTVGQQSKLLSDNLPVYLERLNNFLQIPGPALGSEATSGLETITGSVSSLVGKFIPAVRGIFGGGFTIFLILVLTFYLTTQDNGLKKFLRSVLPVRYQPYFARTINQVQEKMGSWLRGQMLLCGVIFVLTAVAFFTLNAFTGAIPFWLLLALIAGVTELIPFLGPFISGAISGILVLGNSLWVALVVIGIYILIQQLENNVLVPKIMQKSVGLNPIIIILVVVVGGRLGGVIGAIIAIPVAAAIDVFLKDVWNTEKAAVEESS